MIAERRPQVSPFSDIELIANWHVQDVHFPTNTRPHPAAAPFRPGPSDRL
jgi:hypothetical protein